MAAYKLISANSHIVEPTDFYNKSSIAPRLSRPVAEDVPVCEAHIEEAMVDVKRCWNRP
jgi:hypothetical protein